MKESHFAKTPEGIRFTLMNRHQILIGLAAVMLLSLLAPGGWTAEEPKAAAETRKFKNIGVEQFEKLRAEKKNVVLDVRTAKEFEAGHMPGAVNIDVNGADFEEKVKALDKSKVYLVHCAAGVRSAKACDRMGKLDFPKLYNLEGGFRAWEKAGKPVEK